MKRTDDQGWLLPHQRWLDTHYPRRPVSIGPQVGQERAGLKRHGPVAADRRQGEPLGEQDVEGIRGQGESGSRTVTCHGATVSLLLGSDNDGLGDWKRRGISHRPHK